MSETEIEPDTGPVYIASCVVPYADLAALAEWARLMILGGHSVRVDAADMPGYLEGVSW